MPPHLYEKLCGLRKQIEQTSKVSGTALGTAAAVSYREQRLEAVLSTLFFAASADEQYSVRHGKGGIDHRRVCKSPRLFTASPALQYKIRGSSGGAGCWQGPDALRQRPRDQPESFLLQLKALTFPAPPHHHHQPHLTRGPNEAGPLTSSDPNELWTDPSGLSCADLRQGNENNERERGAVSGRSPAGPRSSLGHRTG
ncbi:hypothetical protein JZ751_001500 [Albula glossodonta]|uniref:Uncharacterized protein n=1 Tax=Albula glossodonta TaxID=121402 RepID=A0A8T2PTN3_9TELE|nr:hypothetical protein JZ751_001500 [Albula glossodonta]